MLRYRVFRHIERVNDTSNFPDSQKRHPCWLTVQSKSLVVRVSRFTKLLALRKASSSVEASIRQMSPRRIGILFPVRRRATLIKVAENQAIIFYSHRFCVLRHPNAFWALIIFCAAAVSPSFAPPYIASPTSRRDLVDCEPRDYIHFNILRPSLAICMMLSRASPTGHRYLHHNAPPVAPIPAPMSAPVMPPPMVPTPGATSVPPPAPTARRRHRHQAS